MNVRGDSGVYTPKFRVARSPGKTTPDMLAATAGWLASTIGGRGKKGKSKYTRKAKKRR